MNSAKSDFQCFARLIQEGASQLTSIELYKACVSLAYIGQTRDEEVLLPAEAQNLLCVRRQIFNGNFKKAEENLKIEIENKNLDYDFINILRGDFEFIKATLFFRQNKHSEAALQYQKAMSYFNEARDQHRFLRTLINAKISGQSLQSYIFNDLYVLKQKAYESDYFDLVGNISKAHAGELILAGRFSEAMLQASEAVTNYQKDGYPDDFSVAVCMQALAQIGLGELVEAKNTIQKVLVRDGKVKFYLEAYDSLIRGKQPVFPKGHPLYGSKWKMHSIKKESITAKIIQKLSAGPATRDQLIYDLWGPQAVDPSYCNRLYAAMNALRKMGQDCFYDGSFYRLK